MEIYVYYIVDENTKRVSNASGHMRQVLYRDRGLVAETTELT